MFLKKIALVLFLFFSILTNAQNMDKGFFHLENGSYTKAVTFFEGILKTHPENKTARLCFGRAIGLNGNSKKAITIFTNLLNDFPNDFEIALNYGEALLWDKNYVEAKESYIKLLKENNKSFPALLGYANTLSNLKAYEDALLYVNKALVVIPNNPNALLSKKYIRLGLANQKTTNQEYNTAEKILNENFLDFPMDKETLLNLANLYLISNQTKKAEETYKTIGEDPNNKLISLNGLALVSHLNGKDKQALTISEYALKALTTTNTNLTKQTQERYIQALIWNKKYNTAKIEIKNLLETEGSENWILALSATLNIYKSDFKKSLADYNSILKKDSTSFDGNLGKANALKASGYYKNAYKSAEKTLGFYKNQKDAVNFINQLDKQFSPFVKTKLSYSFDNGKNEAFSYSGNITYPLSIKLTVLGDYNFRKTNNKITTSEATANSFSAGLNYLLINNLTVKSKLGLTNSFSEVNNYTELLADIFFNLKPFKLQNLEFGYKRDLQNFNADLMNREIIQNNYIVNYNVSTNFNLGWFAQYYFTNQSDNNNRNLFFTSLYYSVLEKPILKTGFNYQNISFKNQVPTIYFSPKKFNAFEVFFTLIKEEGITKKKEWFYELSGATGFQLIENNEKKSTYRVQGKLGYKFSERAFLNLYGAQTNIASTTATGFNFTEIGLEFKWYFTKLPIFKK